MACRLPGANNIAQFWDLLKGGKSMGGPLPADRFQTQESFFGGFLPDMDQFDAGFFGFTPREAAAMDPQHRLLLETAYEAMQDAGLSRPQAQTRATGVFVGLCQSDYDTLARATSTLDVYGLIGSARNGAAARISHAFDLHGPSFVVDADRASSLVAVHMAVRSLRQGESQVAIAAGANVILNLATTRAFANAGMLATDGHCKFGDASADGIVRSEGVGVVVLKLLDHAVRDRDAIYAVIRGTSVSHMGRSNDIMTPSGAAQQELLQAAYDDAAAQVHDVVYVEAHGTGTPIGDKIELNALGHVLGAGRVSDTVLVGSAKSNVGHTEATAGIVGLIKAALILHHGLIPATLHVHTPNPDVDFAGLHVRLATKASAWPQDRANALVGVTSLGFTGTGAHAVLAAAPAAPPATVAIDDVAQPAVVLLSAQTANALQQVAERLDDWLAGPTAPNLMQLASHTQRRSDALNARLAIVSRTPDELRAKLAAYARQEIPAGVSQTLQRKPLGKLAFIYSGHGSHYLHMAHEMLATQPVFRAAMEACGQALAKVTNWSLLDMLETDDMSQWQIDVIQPILFAMSVSLTKLWESWGVRPDAVIGASMGEVAAAHCAGILSLDDAARVIGVRSLLAKRVVGLGSMMSVGLSHEQAMQLVNVSPDKIAIAVSASPTSTVLSGDTDVLNSIKATLDAQDIFARFVRVDFASHSPFVDCLNDELALGLSGLEPHVGHTTMYSTVELQPIAGDKLTARYWMRNLRDPVLFGQTVQLMAQQGFSGFVEVSAHPLHWDAVIDNLQAIDVAGVVLPTMRRDESPHGIMLGSLATLHNHGWPVDWSKVSDVQPALRPPSYPWEHARYWLDTSHPTVVAHDLVAPPSTAPADEERAPIAQGTPLTARLAKAHASERFEILTLYVRSVVARVLGQADPNSIDSRRPLRECGLKSVMAVELRALLSEAMGMGLPASLLFTYPTIDKLVTHLLTSVTMPAPKAVRRSAQTRMNEPIAIIGMACRFPGADSPDAFWQLLEHGQDMVTEVPKERWDAQAVWDASPGKAGKTVSKWGGFVAHVGDFDAEFFDIAPREAARMDPQQRLLLEVVSDAFEHAGQTREGLDGSRTGMFVGIMNNNEYASIKGLSRDLGVITAQDAVADATSIAAGRLSYFFGLQGPCMSVDTACSSSLVAVHLAMRSLRLGETRMAVAAGVNLILTPEHSVAFSRGGMLSPDGRCKTFDASANGYVRSEGCGAVVLKRVSDAVADGDVIHAILRGSAVNQDGRGAGLTAPNAHAQEAVIDDALVDANATAQQVGYVEAHGTGTPLGDPIEIQALGRAYGKRSADAPLWIGSVKTNIGHLESAAGMAGLLKATLMVQRGVIPPHLHFTLLNPNIELPDALRIAHSAPQPWVTQGQATRIAGVSSFGYSGTNTHVIVEQYLPPEPKAKAEHAGLVVIPLSARSDAALRATARNVATYLGERGDIPLATVAHSAATRRTQHEQRVALVANSRDAAISALEAFAAGNTVADLAHGMLRADRRHRVAYVFSGHGSQHLQMARQLLQSSPVFRDSMTAVDTAIQAYAGWSPLTLLARGTEETWSRVHWVQPTLFAIGTSLAAWWRSMGVEPDAIIGHSMGEVAAAHIAGALGLQDAVRVICERSRVMQAVEGQGAMLVVEMDEQAAQALIAAHVGKVCVAVVNGHTARAIAGDAAVIAELQELLQKQSLFCARANTSVAFHTHHMDGLQDTLVQSLHDVTPAPPAIPLYSTVTGGRVDGVTHDAAYWGRNLRLPVQFAAAAQQAWQDGCRLFIEMSPHPVLTHALRDVTQAKDHDRGLAVASLRRGKDDMRTLHTALASLWTQGYPVDFGRISPPADTVLLPLYPWQRTRHWTSYTPSSETAMPLRDAAAHPLLGSMVPLAHDATTWVWDGSLGVRSLPYLADHQVAGMVVVPGAAFMEMMLAACTRAWDVTTVRLTDMSISDALVLRGDEDRRIQVSLDARDANRAVLRIYSRIGTTWNLHAQAHATAAAVSAAPPMMMAPVPAVPGDSAATIYSTLRAMGLQYGPQFQNIHEVWLQGGQGFGRMRESTHQPGYVAHPTLLDSAFHVLALQIAQKTKQDRQDGAWVPVRAAAVTAWGTLSQATWSHTQLHPSGDAPRGEQCGTVRIFDAQGALLVEVADLVLKNLPASTAREADAGDFVAHTWEALPTLLPTGPRAALAGQRWLITGGSQGFGVAMQSLLTEHGANATLLPCSDTFETALTQALAATQGLDGVINASALDLPALSAQPETAQRLACDINVMLVQGIAKQAWRTKPQLWLVTDGAFNVGGEAEFVRPEQALSWGIGRTVGYEHPQIACICVDVRIGSERDAAAHSALTVFKEIAQNAREPELALRGASARYAGRLRNMTPAPKQAVPPLQQNATYLITGGLGALGMELAQRLAQQGAGALVLLSRKGLPTPEQNRILEQLRARPMQVLVKPVDVANRDQLSALLDEIHSTLPPLRGIFHAAAALSDALINAQTPERFAQALAAKAYGAWHLDALTTHLPLDFFVLYSSATALLGAPGQSNYAAANAFLDALAHRRAQQNKAALSLNWGPFADIGLAAAEKSRGARMAQRGMRAMTSEQGLQALVVALASQQPQVGPVALDARQWVQFYPHLAASKVYSNMMAARRADAAVAKTQATGRSRISAAAPAQQRTVLEQILREHVGEVLGVKPNSVGFEAPFKAIGLDSLMGLELRNRLEAAFDMQLSATLTLAYFNLQALSGYFAEQLRVGQESPTSSVTTQAAPVVVAGVTSVTDDALDDEALDLMAELRRTLAESTKNTRL